MSAIYYGYVALRYYRKELLRPQGRRPVPEQGHVPAVDNPSSSVALPPDPSVLMKAFVTALNAVLLEASLEGSGKEQLTGALKTLLAQYPSLYDSRFRPDMLHLVRMEAETQCGILFSAEELVKLW